MAAAFSPADIDRLLNDAATRPRIEIAGTLGQALDSRTLTDAEVRTAQGFVATLARDVEVTVRAALASSLRHSRRLPHDVALSLARDVEAVALPILAASLVLSDDDLLDIVRHGSPARQTAIAGRPEVSEPLSAELVALGSETAVTTLVGNANARISEDSLNRAIDRFAHSDAVKGGIAHRDVLPVGVTERLVTLVSEQLQDYLVAHHKLPPTLAVALALRSRERATLDLSGQFAGTALAALVAQMHAGGRLTPTLLLRALCIGDMAFFEFAIAALAAVPVANARILLHSSGQSGFDPLYERSGLPSELCPIFRAATEIVDGTGYDGEARDLERFRARVIARVLTTFDEFPPGNVDYLIDRLGDVLAPA